MTTTLDTLRRARELISDPERWCKECWATDRDGHEVYPDATDAYCWCAEGAVFAVCARAWEPIHALEAYALPLADNIRDWNDAPERTHADVLAAFDRAIDRLEKEQAT